MNGFDSEFKNLKDYILKITYRIWEERGVERIRDYYGEKAPVKTPTSVSYSVEDVISSTWDILKMFPDRQLIGEDVIGSEDLPGTFYSSHRILSTATHLGDGFYGSPSGSKLTYRVVGDCICRENQVIDEWMVRDQSAIVKQIGLEPDQFARHLISNLTRKAVSTTAEIVSRWTDSDDLLTQARLPVQQKISLRLTKPYGNNQNSAFWKNHITGLVRFLGQEHELCMEVNSWLSF